MPCESLIAEDQALLREGLARLFEDAGHEVVAALADAEQHAEPRWPDTSPTSSVVDVRMPPSFTDEGVQAADGNSGAPGRASGWSCCPTYVETQWAERFSSGQTEAGWATC